MRESELSEVVQSCPTLCDPTYIFVNIHKKSVLSVYGGLIDKVLMDSKIQGYSSPLNKMI